MKQNFLRSAGRLLLFGLCWCSRVQAQKAVDYYTQGYELYKNNQFEKAVKMLDKAIEKNPDYAAAYLLRGNIYFAWKDFQYAFLDYSDAIDIEPRNPSNHYNRGNTYKSMRKYDSAVADYNTAISLKPDYLNAYLNRGICFGNLRNRKKALLDFSMAIELDSNSINGYNSRGLNYLFSGDYELAVNDFKKAIDLDVTAKSSYTNINIIEPLARLHRFAEAKTYYDLYRSKYGATGYISQPGWLFYKKYIEAVTQSLTANDYKTALLTLSEAENLYSAIDKTANDDNSQQRGYSSILALKGYVWEQLNKNEEAKHAYEQTLVLNPQQPDVAASLKNLSQKNQLVVQDDKTAPVIKVLEPAALQRSISVEDDKTTGGTQRIRGQAIDPSGIRSLLLNNIPLRVEENGYFDTVVTVVEGTNIFTLVATDKNANTASNNIQVITGKNKIVNAAPPAPSTAVLNYKPVYHAVLIAESDYADKNIPSLKGPVLDMLKMYNLLVNNYVFAPENTDTLVNASRASILEAIIKKANAMGENDNLFIFYAGHGQMITQPDKSEEGFLVPQDAVKGMLSSYISSDDLLRTIKYSNAKHILFVADACFAGSLFRDISSEAPLAVADAYKDKSRKLLASGNRTAVPDQSEFIEYLRLSMQENRERYVTAEQLIDSFKNQYRNSTHLQLQYFPIKNVDDLGGQFVFMRK